MKNTKSAFLFSVASKLCIKTLVATNTHALIYSLTHSPLSLSLLALEGLLEGMNPPPSDPDLFVSIRDCHLLILKMVQGHSGLGPETAMYQCH